MPVLCFLITDITAPLRQDRGISSKGQNIETLREVQGRLSSQDTQTPIYVWNSQNKTPVGVGDFEKARRYSKAVLRNRRRSHHAELLIGCKTVKR
ncbi:MAG TPA: hypothetical protein VFS97_12545 [Nitrososphaeraceae archaeon]|nr:hypothetical protein [Nitrososphaeraceae archaeon]